MTQTLIYRDRRKWGAAAALFGWMTLGAAIDAIDRGSASELVTALVVLGGFFVLFLRFATRKGPALTIGPVALYDGVSGRVVPWDEVVAARVEVDDGVLSREHHVLRLELNADPTAKRPLVMTNANNPGRVEIPLDQLSATWEEIIGLVEAASNTRVIR